MIKENFVWEDSKQEIFSTIKRCFYNRGEVLLWQNTNGKCRIRLCALVHTFSKGHFTLLLKITDGDISQIDDTQEIYLKLDDRHMLCKAKILRVEGESIFVQLPTEVKMQENRLVKRVSFEDNPCKTKIEINEKDVYGKTRFDTLLINLSELGMAINISVTRIEAFEIGREFKVKSIGVKTVQTDLIAEVVHIFELDEGHGNMINKNFLVGLKFNHAVDQEIIDFYKL